MPKLSYKKLDDQTVEETESSSETTIRQLDKAELQTKVDHWERDQVNLQKETDDKLADLQRDIDSVKEILATLTR